MTAPRLRPLISFAAACLLLGSPQALAAQEQEGPTHKEGSFLLPEVQVWQGPSQALVKRAVLLQADGSLMMVDGSIDPMSFPEAEVVKESADWVLYPGLIDGDFSGFSMEAPANAYRGSVSDPREGPLAAMEYGDHAAFNAHLHASDFSSWEGELGADQRAFGYTAAMLLPQRGLVQGHGALVALDACPLGEALLEREGPLLMSLRGVGGYPQTPMAALAVHRQLLLDQTQLSDRLSPDLKLDGPLLFRADDSRTIENLLDLQRDFGSGVGPWIVLGGHGVSDHLDRLKAQGMRVLYQLDLEKALPAAKEGEEAAAAETDRQWWQEPQRLQAEKRRLQEEALGEFLALRAAGIPCALVLKRADQKGFDQVQRLIDAGLDRDQAIAALSVDVAQLLGLPAAADSAFFAQGELDFAKPRISAVWNRGRLFQFSLADRDDQGQGKGDHADSGETSASPMDGRWEMLVETPMGDEEFGLVIAAAETSVEVYDLESPTDTQAANGVAFKGDRQVKFGFTVPEPEMEVTVFLKLSAEGELAGKMKTPFGDVPISGNRPDGDAGFKPSAEAQEPAAKEAAPEKEAEADDEGDGVATGHPAWPVEIEADRLPMSAWAQAREGTVLFKGGTLYPMNGSEPTVGDLLIVDGIIRGVGDHLAAPPDAPVVDASGWHLMPAVIDAHSHLALDAVNEGSVSISAACRIADMIHPHEVGIFRAAAGGTAIAQALHGSANPIGGQAASWTLDYQARRIAELLIPDAPRNIKFALGENVKQSNWDGARGKRFPNSRLGVDAVYRRAFTAAQDYAVARRLAAAGQRPGFRRDVRLEVLADILDNVVHVQCHSYRADELQMFLQVCRDFGIERPTFQHVLEGYKVAPEIAAAGAMASTFSDWWAYKYEVRDAIPWNVEILHKAGVIVSINSDSDEMIRRLNTEAGKAQRYGGLSWQEAMATCTLNSAKQLRLDDRLGSLEVGKEGTVTIFDGPPLSTYSRPVMTLARGVVLYEANPAAADRWQAYGAAVHAFAVAHTGEKVVEQTPPADDEAAWEAWTRPGQGLSYWVQGATVHNPGEEPFVATLQVKDGRIEQLYRGDTAPPQGLQRTTVVKAKGMQLYPAFIDSLDRTGLIEIESIAATRDDEETGQDQPDLSTAVAIHADSAHHQVTRMNGIAYVLARPDFGRIRGRGALIQLEGTTSSDMVVQPDLGMFIRFPRVPREVDEKKGPKEPRGLEGLDEWFDRAEAYRDRLARMEQAGREALDRDPRLDALLPCLNGSQAVFLEAEDAPTLMAARAWVERRGLKAVYVGAQDAWRVAGYFGADGASLILGSVHRLPRDEHDPFDSPFRLAGILDQAGCQVALSTNDPEVTRNLPFQAATAAAFGWERDRALGAITLDAARILGVDRFIGSVEEGKVASFFLTKGDPMDLEQPLERMWIGGKEVELSSHQSRLRDRYLERLPAEVR